MQAQATTPTPAPPSAAPTPAAPTAAPVIVQVQPDGGLLGPVRGEPHLVYQAFRDQRTELRNQLERLENQREEISSQLQAPMEGGASRVGLEARIAQIDVRIAELDKQIAAADQSVARAAAIPGAIIPDPPFERSGPPEEFWVIAGLIMVPSAFILTIAYARRLWRRGAAVVQAIPQEFYERFTRLEHSLDSIAVEVERVGEGQRYLTRMYAEKGLGAGAAQPIEVQERDKERQARR
jgi:hypothetical protein